MWRGYRLWQAVRSAAANESVRAAYVLLFSLAGVALYASVLDRTYAVGDWLFWHLAAIAAWLVLFSVSSLSFGQFVLVRVLKVVDTSALESAALAIAVGVVGFVLAMYAGGALGLYNAQFAIALPIGLFTVGALEGLRLLGRLRAEMARARYGRLSLAAIAFGVLCLGVLYLGLMTPESLNYDATWSHLKVSQDYARSGRIIPFPGDYYAGLPQLASIVQTWGYLVPGLERPVRWMFALHMEFTLLLWTLVGVAAAVQQLVSNVRLSGSWAAFFLFPFIFVYDHNLGGAADHVLAFFSVPALLATIRVCRDFKAGSCALLAIFLAGALLTKYQAVYLIAPMGLIVGVTWLVAWFCPRVWIRNGLAQPERRDLMRAPAVVLGLGALIASPHFIRNYVFHDNPAYPFLQRIFTSSPTVPDAALYFENVFQDQYWVPKGSVADRLVHALKLFFTFSFEPHYSFTKSFPGFGSLFTLLLPGVLVVPFRRLAIPLAAASGAVLVWALTFNVDRNLQAFLPLLVCVTAALIIQLWRLGWLARAGLVALIGLQVVWGGDALFYSSYGRIESAIRLIRSGYEGKARERFADFRREYLQLDDALPKDATVLLHNFHRSLGINRDTVLDWEGFQSLINYDQVRTPRELYDYYKKRGITHLLDLPASMAAPSKQEEVLFHTLVGRYGVQGGRFGRHRLIALPGRPPDEQEAFLVLSLGLRHYAGGLYPIEHLGTNEYLPAALTHFERPQTVASTDNVQALASRADAILVGTKDGWDKYRKRFTGEFDEVVNYPGQFSVHVRRP